MSTISSVELDEGGIVACTDAGGKAYPCYSSCKRTALLPEAEECCTGPALYRLSARQCLTATALLDIRVQAGLFDGQRAVSEGLSHVELNCYSGSIDYPRSADATVVRAHALSGLTSLDFRPIYSSVSETQPILLLIDLVSRMQTGAPSPFLSPSIDGTNSTAELFSVHHVTRASNEKMQRQAWYEEGQGTGHKEAVEPSPKTEQ